MSPQPAPLFLARRAYRWRRVTDAARLLPVAGAVLVLLPILWRPAATPEPDTARGAVYLFAVWGGLIVLSLLLSRRLMRGEEPGRGDGDGDDTGDGDGDV